MANDILIISWYLSLNKIVIWTRGTLVYSHLISRWCPETKFDEVKTRLLTAWLTSMCCFIRSRATTFSAPLGIITSAYFLVGRQNSSKAGLTRVVYWWRTCSSSLPLSEISRSTRLMNQSVKLSSNAALSTLLFTEQVWCQHLCPQITWGWIFLWYRGSRTQECPQLWQHHLDRSLWTLQALEHWSWSRKQEFLSFFHS